MAKPKGFLTGTDSPTRDRCEQLLAVEVLQCIVDENKWTFTSEEHNNETSKIIMFVFEYGLSCECLQYFKMKFPAATVVLSFNDMISGTNGYEQIFENFSLNRLKEISDLIFTYHSIEAEKYDLYYYPQIFSKKELPPEKIKYDVFFVGLAKNIGK